ncbi:MAG: 50S ribosomal protein L11 methyltransferase, partial [Chitinophagaceae bacterium]
SMLNAAENVSANNCGAISLQQADNIPASKSFDIVLANINKQVIVHTLHQMKETLNERGIVLLSGLLESDFADVQEIALNNGLTLNRQLTRSGWIALAYHVM